MTKHKIGNYRWVVCSLLFFATTINYLDRQIIGLLKPTLEAEFHWTETDYGLIVMAFTASYALGLLFFGRLIDKVGSKIGYGISVTLWSIAAMFHAAARSTIGFVIARASLGIGESGNFPAAIKSVAEWFPKKERALATGILNSGANIGAVAAPLMVPWLLGYYSWHEVFVITGAIGFVWLILWWIFYETPEKQPRLKKPEFDYIHSDIEEGIETTTIRWSKLLRIRQTWTFVVGKAMTDPIWYFFLFWLPAYFNTTFNLDLSVISLPLVIVYSSTTIGSIGGGYLSSYFIKKGWPVFKARKITMLIIALCVLPIMVARYTTDIWLAVALISLAAAAHQAWSANIYTTASDMFPKKVVSSVVGIGGMAGSISGALFPLVIGAVLDYYKLLGNIVIGYNIIFTICGSAYLIAWVIMHFLSPKMKSVNFD